MWHRSHPRDRVAIVELQSAIRDASAAPAWHSGTSLHDIFHTIVILGSSMWHQHGRECVWLPTVHVWTRCHVAASDSATVVKTCRPSPTCSTLPTSSTVSIQTPTTYYSHTYVTRATYLTSSKTALII